MSTCLFVRLWWVRGWMLGGGGWRAVLKSRVEEQSWRAELQRGLASAYTGYFGLVYCCCMGCIANQYHEQGLFCLSCLGFCFVCSLCLSRVLFRLFALALCFVCSLWFWFFVRCGSG